VNSLVIPIACADTHAQPGASGGCGACLSSAAGPVCRAALCSDAHPQHFEGPPELVRQLVAELDAALAVQRPDDPGAPTSLVHSLTLGDGEADLKLAVASRCAGAHLVDAAFQALRRLLPDTDIYVSSAG
jgi:hypothetical protein